MKLTNETNWDTRDLRKILAACIKRDGCRDGFKVTITKRRRDAGGSVGGYAYRRGPVRLSVLDPGPMKDAEEFRVWVSGIGQGLRQTLAQVMLHELQHVRGERHRDMIEWWEIDASWVKDFPLRLKEVKQKPERDLRWERYEKVLARIVEKERKKKYLQTSLDKLYKKRKYYERVLKV